MYLVPRKRNTFRTRTRRRTEGKTKQKERAGSKEGFFCSYFHVDTNVIKKIVQMAGHLFYFSSRYNESDLFYSFNILIDENSLQIFFEYN